MTKEKMDMIMRVAKKFMKLDTVSKIKIESYMDATLMAVERFAPELLEEKDKTI